MNEQNEISMLIEVEWNDSDRTFLVSARASGDEEWTHIGVSEDQLAEGLSIARDIVTGG